MSNSETTTPKGLTVEGILGLVALGILLIAAVIWTARGPRVEKIDFSTIYLGATIVNRGEAASLYDREFQVQVRDHIFVDPNPLLFEHPPFEALLLSPLAKLPYRRAYLCWGILNAVAWIVVVYCLRPHCPWPVQDLGYICLWPLFAPLGVALFQGQSSLLVMAFFSAAFVLLRKEQSFGAGLSLGLALFKLQLVLPFALVFLFRRKWRFIAGFATTAAILAVLSIWAVGFRGIVQYARFLLAISGNPQDQSYGSAVDMGSIYGLGYALLGHIVPHAALSIACAAVSVVLCWWVAKQWKVTTHGASGDLLFAAAIAIALSVGFHMFTHDFSPLMLSLLLAGRAIFTNRGVTSVHDTWHIAARSLLIAFWIFPLYFVLVAAHALYLLSALLLWLAIVAVREAKCVGNPKLLPDPVAAR